MSTWEVGVKGLDNQTSFYILDLMWWLDVEDWEKLYNTIILGTSYKQETTQLVISAICELFRIFLNSENIFLRISFFSL